MYSWKIFENQLSDSIFANLNIILLKSNLISWLNNYVKCNQFYWLQIMLEIIHVINAAIEMIFWCYGLDFVDFYLNRMFAFTIFYVFFFLSTDSVCLASIPLFSVKHTNEIQANVWISENVSITKQRMVYKIYYAPFLS